MAATGCLFCLGKPKETWKTVLGQNTNNPAPQRGEPENTPNGLDNKKELTEPRWYNDAGDAVMMTLTSAYFGLRYLFTGVGTDGDDSDYADEGWGADESRMGNRGRK